MKIRWWQTILLGIGTGAIIFSTGMYADSRVMNYPPKATPAVFMNPLPPTFSIYSDNGMLLYAGVCQILFCRNGAHKGIFFIHEGQRRFLVLQDHEAVLIKADPEPLPLKSGPRK